MTVNWERGQDALQASELLNSYLSNIFGESCKVTEGQSTNSAIQISTNLNLNPDEYKIEITNKKISIQGGRRKGATYAVIHLLETYFNCKYLSPDYRIVPKAKRIDLPQIQIHENPENDVRIINLYFDENQEYRDWLRLNSIEEVYPEGYFVHTFHKLLPWEDYFAEHPEYFALVNGKRTIDQLCTSNEDVRKIIAKKLKIEMKLQPDKVKWSVSQNDNYSYCQCDKCKAKTEEEGSPAGPVIDLVNAIANQFPDKIISTLAYQYSRKAPLKIKPLKNVEVMLCTIELHRNLPIEKDPEAADFKKDMEDWGKICSNIFLWDYTINFNHSISPFPNLHILQPNIQFFTKNNVNALFEQSNSTTGYEFSELKAHLLSKLMWNPDCDLENLKADFLTNYYGEASVYIDLYITEMEKYVLQNNTKLWIYEHPVAHQNGLFSKANLMQWNELFDKAELAVKSDNALLNRVKKARLPLQYAEMEIAANNMFTARGWYLITDGKPVASKRLMETLAGFEQVCSQNNVPTVNEAKLSPEDYISSLRKMTDVKIEGNFAFGKKVTASVLPDPKYQEGNLSYLTNGVSGASDYNIHWLGWFGKDVELILDLELITDATEISLNSLWNAKSWILHPSIVSCSVSENGNDYSTVGELNVEGNQEKEQPIRTYNFETTKKFRYVKIAVKGAGKLPNWHPSAGESSWFFLDEITVKYSVF